MLDTLSSGTWTPLALPYPSGSYSSPDTEDNYLASISCSSPGNCAAVGQYQDASQDNEGLIETQSAGGAWTAAEVGLPGNAVADSNTRGLTGLTGVDCTSDGNCTAIGIYDTALGYEPMVETETDGAWGQAVELTAALGFLPEGTILGVPGTSISCVSAGNCLVVGTQEDTDHHYQPTYIQETGGTWSSPTQVSQPSGASASDPGAGYTEVSCTSDDGCTAIGYYANTSNVDVPIGSSGSITTGTTGATGTSGTSGTSGSGGGAAGGGGSTGSTGQTGSPITPPTATIDSSKISKSKHRASFSFSASGAASFECALVRAHGKHHKFGTPSYSTCTSPHAYKHLKKGSYEFLVRAIGAGGPQELPAVHRFKVG
jgi:hypothetical protein